ncbi:MAG: phenylalanine--tRNA ligase subunit alpha [Dehalococcoidia bacterium]|nr:phenylalanine--tRNA ligase subunit alpha [Dehalococcoidia bacterium]
MTTEGTSANEALRARVAALRRDATKELASAGGTDQLEGWRVKYLGRRQGTLTALMKELGTLAPAERRALGAEANPLRLELEAAFDARKQAMETRAQAGAAATKPLDVTLPGRAPTLGKLHPTTLVLREITSAFASLGFQVMEGPEVEWDSYNFEALNIPQDHPARDMWDTIWIDYTDPDKSGGRPMLLRTHTSPMQIRIMERTRPPIRAIVPGRVYRYEAMDATHESSFFQVEGLAVDEQLTFAHLKGCLFEFAKRLFGPQRQVRFRCDYFPFVEPGVDLSIDCFACAQDAAKRPGCRVCKQTGWIEIMGAGMVHPQVLRRVNIDPERYAGFAFGLGVERIAMLKYGIEDIRLFYANDLRFLRQF